MNKIKDVIKKLQFMNVGITNKLNRDLWIEKTLSEIPPDLRILDAGAGELQYKKFCAHLEYVSQDDQRQAFFLPYCLTRKSYHKRIVASTKILP